MNTAAHISDGLEFTGDARNRLAFAAGGGRDRSVRAVHVRVRCPGRLLFKDSPHGGDYLWDCWRMVKKQAWLESGSGECDGQKIGE